MSTAEPKGRVLLVDDEVALLRAESRHLTRAGYAVECATNGEEALAALQKTKFDCVVTDITMPKMTGLELLKKVRAYDTDLPVVLVTGAPSLSTATVAVEFGALKYLMKPVDTQELISTVTRAVQLYKLAQVRRLADLEMGRPDGDHTARPELEAAFDRCLDGLWMAFQPIIQVPAKGLYGYEALLRSTEKSLPHPGAVLDAAERLGRLHDLGRRIRQRIFDELKKDQREFKVFINLHPQDLLDAELLSMVKAEQSFAKRLVLEVTERASLDRIPDARARIKELRDLGCSLAVDDLGAGYAGLSSFVQMEPDIVKLDMSLVRDVDKSPLKQKLVGSLTSVCRDMGLLIVAEGIETAEERDTAVTLGCDLLQGYRLGKPAAPFVEPLW